MPLSDTAIRAAKPREKPYKMGDAGGLFLLVQPTGGKLWRLKYRVHGKEKKLALGTYPAVSLQQARQLRDEAKTELETGKDPSREKKRRALQAREEASNTFDSVAAEYFSKRKAVGKDRWAPATAAKNDWLLTLLLPDLGTVPIGEIQPIEVLASVRKIEAKGNLETARRTMQLASSIFRHAVATAKLKSDPTRDIRGALATPEAKPRAAILEPGPLGELLRAIDGYSGHYTTKYALQIAPHVFLRPGELRMARWPEVDFEAAVWRIPASRTKMRKPHTVPLSQQVLTMLRELWAVRPMADSLLFPSVRATSRPISENTLNAALRRMGYTSEEVSSHGFRSTASTLLNEARHPETGAPLWSADAIEKALAHGDADNVRGAYHRGTHWDERVRMAQWWSDYLDRLKTGADILPLAAPKSKSTRSAGAAR